MARFDKFLKMCFNANYVNICLFLVFESSNKSKQFTCSQLSWRSHISYISLKFNTQLLNCIRISEYVHVDLVASKFEAFVFVTLSFFLNAVFFFGSIPNRNEIPTENTQLTICIILGLTLLSVHSSAHCSLLTLFKWCFRKLVCTQNENDNNYCFGYLKH